MSEENLPPSVHGPGYPVDPTKNVLDLVQAAMERQDDLREVWNKVFEAKLDAVQEKFNDVERLRLENKNDSKSAVDAALAAAKELVSSQATTAKEAMDQQAATSQAALNGIMTMVNDLKERLVTMEASKQGVDSQKNESRSSTSHIFVIAGGVGSIIILLIAIATFAISFSR